MILFIVKIISTRNLKIFLTNKKKIYKQKKIVYLFDKKKSKLFKINFKEKKNLLNFYYDKVCFCSLNSYKICTLSYSFFNFNYFSKGSILD